LVVYFTNRKNAPILFSTRIGTRPQEIAIYDLHETSDGWGRIATTPIRIVGSVGGVVRIDWLQEQNVIVDYVDPEGTKKSQITLDLKSRVDRR